MSVMQWADSRTRAMTAWDLGILKLYTTTFGIIVGALIPSLVQQYMPWFVIAVLMLGGFSAYRWFTAEPHRD